MSKQYEPDYLFFKEIVIFEIIFDDTQYLTLYGTVANPNPFENNYIIGNFCCDFSQLTDLLLFGGEDAEQILKELSENVLNIIDNPSVIDVEEILGHPLVINNIIIKMYEPQEIEDAEESEEETKEEETSSNIFIIDAIEEQKEQIPGVMDKIVGIF